MFQQIQIVIAEGRIKFVGWLILDQHAFVHLVTKLTTVFAHVSIIYFSATFSFDCATHSVCSTTALNLEIVGENAICYL